MEIIIGISLVALLLYILLVVYFSQMEKRECKEYMTENFSIYTAEITVRASCQDLSEKVSPCNRCEEEEMQLWDNFKNDLSFRCTNCRKKYKLKNYFSQEELNSLNEAFENLYRLISKVEETNDLGGWKKLRGWLHEDYGSLRANSPYIRAFRFYENAEEPESFSMDNRLVRKIPQQVKNKVWNRDGGRCIECGSNEKLEFDHIIPFSKGGADTYRNIQLLCEPCNRRKSDFIGGE